MKLNDKIYEYRKINRWSQEELADKLNVSRQTISKWEVGKAVPELDKLIKLAELFEISVDDLVKDEIDIVSKKDRNESLEKDNENISNEEFQQDFNAKLEKNNLENKVNNERKNKIKKIIKLILIILVIILIYKFISDKVTILKREKDIKEIAQVYNDNFGCVGETESAFAIESVIKRENNVITETFRHYYIYAEDGKKLVKAKEYEDKNSQNLIKEIYIDLSKKTYTDLQTNMRIYDDVTEVYINDWSKKVIDNYEFISPMDRISDGLADRYVDIAINSKMIALDEDNIIHVTKYSRHNMIGYGWSYGTKNDSGRTDYLNLYMMSNQNWMSFYFDDYKNDIADSREIVSIQLTKQKGSIEDVTIPEL